MDGQLRNRCLVRGSFCLVAACAAVGLAASSGRAQSKSVDPPNEPVLKGPEVKDRDVPGVAGAFGTGTGARRMAERIPPDALRGALGVLLGDDVAPELRASQEQETRIRAIGEEFRAAQRAYMAEHRAELIELRREANLTGRGAQEIDRAIGRARPGDAPRERPRQRDAEPSMQQEGGMTMDDATEERQDAARQRLRLIMEGAPRVEDFYTRIWESLSEPQRKAVDGKLDEWRAAEAKRREEAYVRQRMQDRERAAAEAGPDAARPAQAQREQARREQARRDQAMPGGMSEEPMRESGQRAARPGAERPNAAQAQRRERLMRLFERLSPEQQENLLERLEGAVREGALGGPAARGRGQRGGQNDGAKPAPSMDGVEVPDPKEVE